MNDSVSVVGLGKLGLCLASCFAYRGIKTIGVDIERNVVDSINAGITPIVEPRLDEMIAELGGKQLRATLSHKEAIDETDVTFILVATPSNSDGSFSNRHVESAIISLATAFKDCKKSYHLFVISSTVVPDSTEGAFIPLIQKHSGKKLNVDFGVCFDPDFVALGDVVKGFLRPELVIIGESSVKAGEQVERLHSMMCENEPVVKRMSLISAEIAKVSLNAYITVKISFANTLANLCERIPGADVDAITSAIGVDKRISPYYLQGGLSFGGTCFPRDMKAFKTIAEQHGSQAELVRAAEIVNMYQDNHLASLVLKALEKVDKKAVGIIGLAFKPKTPVITESSSIKLIPQLLQKDVLVVAYDQLAVDNIKAIFGNTIAYVNTPTDCLDSCGVCVLTYRSDAIVEVIESYKPEHPTVLIDCWRMLDPGKLDEKFIYHAIGRCG